jgi:hypothetical protein
LYFDIPVKKVPDDEFHHALVLFRAQPRVIHPTFRLTLKSSKISDSGNVLISTSPNEVALCGNREYTRIQKFCKSSGVIVKKIAGMPNLIKKEE